MPAITQVFLNGLARHFLDRRIDLVADHFVYPLPFYSDDKLQVFGAACTLQEALAMYRDAIDQAGIVRIVPRIVAEGIAVGGYSNVWVEWDHIDHADLCQRVSQVHYVLNWDGATPDPKIELVEYTATAFPEVPASFLMALSA